MVEHDVNPVDAIFSALGEPTRRRMVERLARAEATVSELAEPFAMSLQAVSKHVGILEAAGLVRRTRVGRAHHVALVPGALQVAGAWLDARVEAGPAPARVPLPFERQADLVARARAMHARLAGRMALVRRALAGEPASPRFDPAAAAVRALGARRPQLEVALALYDALGRQLEDPDLDALRGVVLPLSRLMYDLRAFFPAAA